MWLRIATLVLLLPPIASAEAWTPASLLRGPTAILNAPLVPFRSAAGGVVAAREDRTPGLQRQILLPPTLAVAGGAMGIVEAVAWLGTGLADTLTGGAFALAPDEATHLSVAPLPPLFMPNARQQPAAPSR